MITSRLHWRLLTATMALLVGAALAGPHWAPPRILAENRPLAERPAWPRHIADLRGFTAAADAYAADHFPARPYLISALNRARMLVGVSGSAKVIVGRDGWLFYDNDSHFGGARNDPPMSRADMRDWLFHLAGRTEALRARRAAYVLIAPPYKEMIYPEHGPSWYGGPSPGRPAAQLPGLAARTGAGEVLYLHDAVAGATRRGWKTFSRHDTHWTGYGAYFGYVAIMTRLQALGLTEGPLPMSAFDDMGPDDGTRPRDVAMMLGVADLVRLDYPHIDNLAGWAQARKTFLTDKTDWTAPQLIETGHAGKPVLLLTRDSFSNELIPMLLPHFSRIVLAHNQDGTWRQDLIDRFDPDIVMLEVIETGLQFSAGDGPPPSPAAVARIDHLLGPMADEPTMGPLTVGLAKRLAGSETSSRCKMDTATLTARAEGDAALTIAGWFAPHGAWLSSRRGWVVLQGARDAFTAPLTFAGPRPDVAAALKSAGAAKSGFSAQFAIRRLPRGLYAATVYRRTSFGWVSCRSDKLIGRLSATAAPP